MEGLIELVAASFARHGIECPADNPQLISKSTQAMSAPAVRAAEQILTKALPEHNYRKSPQADPTP